MVRTTMASRARVAVLRRSYSIAILLWLALTGCDEKPTRSECIIGFSMDWTEVKADSNDVLHSMVRPTRTRIIEPLTAMAISPDGRHLYLQFSSDCDRKLELAEALIAYWRSEGVALPEFERIEEPIVPSTETIDVRGPPWSDGWPAGDYNNGQ